MIKVRSEKEEGIREALGVKWKEGFVWPFTLRQNPTSFLPLYFPIFHYEEQLTMIDGLLSGAGRT
jgi:hypothetical protein